MTILDSDPDMAAGPARARLRRVLFADAATAAAAGLALAVLPQSLARMAFPDGGALLGIDVAGWLLAGGLGFILFAAAVLATALPARPRHGAVAAVVAANLAFLAGCALLLAMAGGAMSWTGWVLVVLAVDLVGIVTWLEARHLRASRTQAAGDAARRAGQPQAI